MIGTLKSRRMTWAGHATRMEVKRNVYRILVGKPEAKRPVGRPRHRWVDNIKMNIKLYGMLWIDVAQDRPVEGSCEHGNEPSGCIIFLGKFLSS
jgi:hypothetical protein